MREIISFTIKRELRERIDTIRGDIPRSKYINKALEQHVVKLDKDFKKDKLLPVDNSLATGYQQAAGIVRGEN